jgi:hypothetical protein
MATIRHNSTLEIIVGVSGYDVGVGPAQWTLIADPMTNVPLEAQAFSAGAWAALPVGFPMLRASITFLVDVQVDFGADGSVAQVWVAAPWVLAGMRFTAELSAWPTAGQHQALDGLLLELRAVVTGATAGAGFWLHVLAPRRASGIFLFTVKGVS